ncbi:MAG: hypothetical protein R3B91_08145 [Planctomycetaceae bacterium]
MLKPTLTTLFFASLCAITLPGCDVDVEDPGALPTVDIEPGEAPDVDVHGPEVDVHAEEETVTVPDVDVEMEEKTITVPDMDVDIPAENEN